MVMEVPSTVKAQFLSNNDPLDPQYLDIAQARTKFLSQKINELGLELELELEVARHQDDIAQYKLLLSPFRWLPLEIIGEIFTLLFVEGAPRWEAELINLCLVCKRWRVAALLTPHLWSNTQIYLSHHPISFDSVVSWLNRSKSVPRTLVVKIPWRPREAAPRESERDLCDILTRGPTIDTLKIECTEQRYTHLRRLFRSFQGDSTPHPARPWDMIKTFSLTNYASAWRVSVIETESMYLEMPPAIESLVLSFPGPNSGHYDLDPMHSAILHTPEILIGRLTTLVLTCDRRGIQLFVILQQCINLQHLVLDFRSNFFRPDRSLPHLILPKLITLSAEQVPVESIPAFFDRLTAPSLLYLVIQTRDPATPGQSYDGKLFGHFLQRAPRLLYLCLGGALPRSFERNLIPNLPSLVYFSQGQGMFPWKSLLYAVKDRWKMARAVLPEMEVPETFDCDVQEFQSLLSLPEFAMPGLVNIQGDAGKMRYNIRDILGPSFS